MKQFLLRIERPMVEFAKLVAALRQEGFRVGRLEMAPTAGGGKPAPVPESLGEAESLGVLRAVSVGGGRSIAVKPMRGEPVLRDVLREHFRGCRIVLVSGPASEARDSVPLLERGESSWKVSLPRGETKRYTTQELIAALRRPDPWPVVEGADFD